MRTEEESYVMTPRHSSWEIGFDLSDDRGRGQSFEIVLC